MSVDLLTDLRALRNQARADRRAYAFPLFLFGSAVLAAGTYWWTTHQDGCDLAAVLWTRR